MAVIIPDEVLRDVRMTERELRRELAVMLFREERMTLSRACRLADMSRLEFQRLLADRQIPVHYDVEEFRQDLNTLHEAGML